MHGIMIEKLWGEATRSEGPWCTEVGEHGLLRWFGDLQAARTEFGRPRSSIWLRTVTAIRVSTS
jgi:hypothetical protein